jgi:hypothetical protein
MCTSRGMRRQRHAQKRSSSDSDGAPRVPPHFLHALGALVGLGTEFGGAWGARRSPGGGLWWGPAGAGADAAAALPLLRSLLQLPGRAPALPAAVHPATGPAEGAHCMHAPAPPPAPRDQPPGGRHARPPPTASRVARWAGAGRRPWWPCSSQPRRGVTCGCWGAMGAIGKPYGGTWAPLSGGFSYRRWLMSVEMAVG